MGTRDGLLEGERGRNGRILKRGVEGAMACSPGTHGESSGQHRKLVEVGCGRAKGDGRGEEGSGYGRGADVCSLLKPVLKNDPITPDRERRMRLRR
jgi:hypothetical protein